MVKSILRHKPDVIEYPDENGGKICVIADDWLMGNCQCCGKHFLVESNEGDLRCPHGCQGAKIEWVWVKPQTIYVQEHEPQEIVNGQMKKTKV